MPLLGKGHFKENVRTLMHEVGKSPHVQSREQALAIAYSKERGHAEGGRLDARLKRAPNRELLNRPSTDYSRWEQFPSSENVEDRRGDIGNQLWQGLRAGWSHFPGNVYRYARGGVTLPRSSWMGIPPYGSGWRTHLPGLKMPGGRGFKHLQEGGFIDSNIPGRTDKHYVTVNSGSYVLPADHVSALGQNNSNAGAEVVRKMFGAGTKFGPRLAIPRFAGGGSVEPVPIVVAGGEIVLPPNIVRRIGNGDLGKGHEVLDRWVLATRKKHIDKLKSLKPPKGADEK